MQQPIIRNLAGLDDPQVQVTFLQRTDITLSEAQLDRCTSDTDFSARMACTSRPDYRLTQDRFERIIQDTNANVPARMFERARRDGIELKPMIDAALKRGDAASSATVRDRVPQFMR